MKKIIMCIIAMTIICVENYTYASSSTKYLFRKEGFAISEPYASRLENSSNLYSQFQSKSDDDFVSLYTYVGNANTDNAYYFTLYTYDISYLFAKGSSITESQVYNSYLNPNKGDWRAYNPKRTTFCGSPAVVYSRRKELYPGVYFQVKSVVVCVNKKAYWIELTASNANYWVSKLESSIQFVK